MADIQKPDMTKQWASSGDKTPPSDALLASGWNSGDIPSNTDFNYIDARQDQGLAYLLQKGVPEWDSGTEYQANKSYVQYGGKVYKCIQTGTNKQPDTQLSYWRDEQGVSPSRTIMSFDGTGVADGSLISFAGRDTVGDGGGGSLRFLAGSTATADGGTIYAVTGGRLVRDGWTVFGFNGELQFRWFGAVGDGVTDDTAAINAAFSVISTFGGGKVAGDIGTWAVSSTIRIPSRTHFEGIGDKCQFKWIGSAPAAGSKTPVISVATIDPVNTAVSDVVVESFSINCNNTPNLVGAEFVYASVMSRGVKIRVDDVGENGAGFRFAKLWYTNFDTLSVRCSTKNSGSIGFWLDTGSIATGEINGIQFRNLQTNKCSIGLLIDTTNYIYACEFSGVFEQGDVGIRHVGKKGVRQSKFNGVYLESNTTQVDWQKDAAPTDSSQHVMWENVQTQYGASVWNIAEGRHWIRGCDSITTLNNSGAQIRIEGDAGVNVVDTGGGRTLLIRSPSNLPQGSAYASVYAKPQAAASVRNVLSAASISVSIPIPNDLLNSQFPTYGREIRLHIFARKWSNTQNRWWEGYLVQRDNQTWGIFKASYSSAEDSTWSVAVDSTTGTITVTYNDVSEGKVIVASFIPM